jgi:hypothetical protein
MVRLEGNSLSKLLVDASSPTLAVSLFSMSTVSPIIPSIDPDRTSFTASLIEDEVFGISTVGDPLGVVRFGCILGALRFGCILGALRFGCILGALRFGCILGALRFGCILGALRFGAVMFDWAFDRS